MAADKDVARKNALAGYYDAREQLAYCLEELKHAMSSAAGPDRIRLYQQHVEAAMQQEQEAFARVRPFLQLQVAPAHET